MRQYPWTDSYTTDRYADLLRSFSDHRRLGEERLDALLQKANAVIETHGGTISRHLLAVTFLCKPT